jgi:hypothetical protein
VQVKLCFDFSRQEQLSELLRKMAEHFLMQMVLTLFSETSDDVGGPPPNWQGCLCEVLQFLAALTNPGQQELLLTCY